MAARKNSCVDLLAKVLSAVMGSSMSMSIRSWLKRFSVTPVSTVEKNDIGDLFTLAFWYWTCCINLPENCTQELLMEGNT